MKKIFIVVIILLCGLIGILIYNKNVNIKATTDERKAEIEYNRLEDENEEQRWSYRFYVLQELVKNEPDWDKIIIPDDLKTEYKNKYPNGLFYDEKYDTVELQNDIEEEYVYNNPGQIFIAKKGKKQDRYIIHCDESVRYCKIESITKEELFDENGNKMWNGYVMDEEHWLSNLFLLCRGDNDEVGKSENFYNNYPNFFGMLIPYPYDNTAIIDVKWMNEKCSFADKEAYCWVYNPYRMENVDIHITYTTDDMNYIDTYNVDIIGVEEVYTGKENFNNPFDYNVEMRLIYKNRDWIKLPLTSNFNNKFNSDDGIFGKMNIINYKGINYNDMLENKSALELTLDDFSKKYVGLIYKIVDNKIDDIEIHYLPDIDYSNMSKEEIYNMF